LHKLAVQSARQLAAGTLQADKKKSTMQSLIDFVTNMPPVSAWVDDMILAESVGDYT
jgi:hypothetical protein